MPQINVDFLCFQCRIFLPWVPFPFAPAPSACTFSAPWDQTLQLLQPVTDRCVQEMWLSVLWMLFLSPNPVACWGSHHPRAGWTSGAVVGSECFLLEPTSSLWEIVSLYWKPALERGETRWGTAPEMTLNLLPPPGFPRQCVLPLPCYLALPTQEGLISQDLNPSCF